MLCKYCDCPEPATIKDNPPHRSAFCSCCGKWITHVRQQPDDDFILFFGKFKGRNVKSMAQDKSERQYLVWLYDNASSLKQNQKRILESLLHL